MINEPFQKVPKLKHKIKGSHKKMKKDKIKKASKSKQSLTQKKKQQKEESEELEEDKKEESKISEKSELEEEVEKQEISNQSGFSQFVQVRSAPPTLGRVIQKEPEITSLEQGIGITPISGKKEPERKYDETEKYDIESEYQESIKRQREITPGMVSQIAPISPIDLRRVGRERIIPGQEFHMGAPAEMPPAPTSSEEYELIKVKKSKRFKGEKTLFQENLERRYEIK